MSLGLLPRSVLSRLTKQKQTDKKSNAECRFSSVLFSRFWFLGVVCSSARGKGSKKKRTKRKEHLIFGRIQAGTPLPWTGVAPLSTWAVWLTPCARGGGGMFMAYSALQFTVAPFVD
jgi:hypothetical protein